MIDFTLWSLRGANVHFDPYEEYVGQPTMFSIQVFHGGEFVEKPARRYINGKTSYFDKIDSDEFSVMEFNAMFKMLHYPEDEVVYYHYRIPDKNLDEGIRALGTDQDVIDMCQYLGRIKLIEVYVEHWFTKLDKQLVGGRDKPIITCLEYIREYLMKKIVVVHKQIAKSNGPLTPYATRVFNEIKTEASQYSVMMAGRGKFQVSGPYMDQCAVNVNERSCSCRKWELTGMPCKHAVAALWDMARNGIQVGVVESWVDKLYWLDTWKDVYMNTIDPINGREFWTPSACPTTLTPPKHHTQVGRPKKKRKKSQSEIAEEMVNKGKLTRKGVSKTCAKCGNEGHNSRTCTGQGGDKDKTKAAKAAKSGKVAKGSKRVGKGAKAGTLMSV